MDVVDGHAAPGGSPFNMARALSRLGVPAAFMGHLSNDSYGRALLEALGRDGVDTALVSIGHEKTTLAVASVDGEGLAHYEFAVEGTAAPNLTSGMLPPRLDSRITAICTGSLGLALEPMASTLAELVSRERGGRVVILDPNVRPGLVPDDAYRGRLQEMAGMSTIVKASEEDLAWLYPGLDREAAVDKMLEGGVALVAVTLGAAGALAAHEDALVTVPAVAVDIVDTIGAGDAFGAALVAWLHEHSALEPDLDLPPDKLRAALEFACLAAAITCTRAGADPPRREEIDARRLTG
jgi:fructokinase